MSDDDTVGARRGAARVGEGPKLATETQTSKSGKCSNVQKEAADQL